jgi:hypothetical protein
MAMDLCVNSPLYSIFLACFYYNTISFEGSEETRGLRLVILPLWQHFA